MADTSVCWRDVVVIMNESVLSAGGCSDATMLDVGWLAQGELVVVETEEDRFVGTAEVTEHTIVVRSGRVGRPVVLAHEQVVRVTRHADLSEPE